MTLVPVPDLTPIEARLKVLQHNVLKSFPRNIWGNQDGSFSFLRVRVHLEAFKVSTYIIVFTTFSCYVQLH